MILLGLLVVVLDVIALVNILLSSMSVGGKLLWAVVVIVLPVLGMLLCQFIFLGAEAEPVIREVV